MTPVSQSLEELQQLLDRADHAYYSEGRTIMEDARYDALKGELARRNPDDPRLRTVGATIRETILQKKAHAIPMGSQSKVTTREEFEAWLQNNLCKPLGLARSQVRLHASVKCDGGSVSLEYQHGRFVSAVSRGDGRVGEDITANALRFRNVPKFCLLGEAPFTGFVRGEIVLSIENWKLVDDDQASNPRNCAVGIMRRKNGEQSEYLQVYAFRGFTAQGTPLGRTEAEQQALLTQMGFVVAPGHMGTPDEVWAWYLDVQKRRSSLGFWIDGVVACLDDLAQQLSLGETDSRPKGQVAIKFEAESAETVLRSVTLRVGHTGAIIPVGTFNPVQLAGTTVTSATLCNFENVDALGIAVGDHCTLIKAGDIIPRVMEVTVQGPERIPIVPPAACPACGGAVGRRTNVSGEEGAVLYCLSDTCPAKRVGKIDHYLSSLDILGIGDELLNALVTELGVQDAADLYTLHRQPGNLANLKLSGKVRLGEKRAERFLSEIEKRRTLSLSDFLGSLGIFGLGKRRVALVQQAVPGAFDTLDDWLSGKLVQCADQAGLPNTAECIQRDLLDQKPLIDKFFANGVTLTGSTPKHAAKPGTYTICITGALSQPKAHYQALIEAAGHMFTDTYSPKTVTHLVAADPSGSSSKLQKARKAGIPILTEAELLALVER
jgi:DNA ligase (NAD+)